MLESISALSVVDVGTADTFLSQWTRTTALFEVNPDTGATGVSGFLPQPFGAAIFPGGSAAFLAPQNRRASQSSAGAAVAGDAATPSVAIGSPTRPRWARPCKPKGKHHVDNRYLHQAGRRLQRNASHPLAQRQVQDRSNCQGDRERPRLPGTRRRDGNRRSLETPIEGQQRLSVSQDRRSVVSGAGERSPYQRRRRQRSSVLDSPRRRIASPLAYAPLVERG